jgi:hypothetical protein
MRVVRNKGAAIALSQEQSDALILGVIKMGAGCASVQAPADFYET